MNEVWARLLVEQGPLSGEEFALAREKSIIGRASGNDIIISDAEISRHHAEITRLEANFAINDLGSTNGTFVNDLRVIGPTPLNHGDLIELGETITLLFLTTATGDPQSPAESIRPTSTMDTVYQSSAAAPPLATPLSVEGFEAVSEPGINRRRWALGCGCGCLLVVILCMATLFFLDGYDQGRLLYCGPLQSVFESVLGPFGFSPVCALP